MSATTSAIVFSDRYMPAGVVVEQAKALHASGVVDTIVVPDQLNNFIPPSLWTPENSPLAAVLPDIDSAADAFTTAAHIAGALPEVDLTLTTDALRRNPAELIQSMLTLANITEGRVLFQVGGGEQKQCRPYGHKRGQGLKRMEDLFELFNRLWDADGMIDYEGHHTTFKQATLGGAKNHRPDLWALGGGPMLLDLATTHCGGFAAAAPCVWASPEQAGDHIAEVKEQLERKGRDPDEFDFGIYSPVLLHTDEGELERAMDNPMVRWMAAVYGRIDPSDWSSVGLPSPVPEDWTYYMNMVPHHETPEFIDQVLAATTREHVEQGFFVGTPESVASTMGDYVEAGVTWVLALDYMALLTPPQDAAAVAGRGLEVCRLLKGAPAPA